MAIGKCIHLSQPFVSDKLCSKEKEGGRNGEREWEREEREREINLVITSQCWLWSNVTKQAVINNEFPEDMLGLETQNISAIPLPHCQNQI